MHTKKALHKKRLSLLDHVTTGRHNRALIVKPAASTVIKPPVFTAI